MFNIFKYFRNTNFPPEGLFLTLPDELILDILTKLPISNLLHLCQTNQRIYNICQDEKFWKIKYNNDFPDIPRSYMSWKQSYLDIYNSIYNLPVFYEKENILLTQLPGSRYLKPYAYGKKIINSNLVIDPEYIILYLDEEINLVGLDWVKNNVVERSIIIQNLPVTKIFIINNKNAISMFIKLVNDILVSNQPIKWGLDYYRIMTSFIYYYLHYSSWKSKDLASKSHKLLLEYLGLDAYWEIIRERYIVEIPNLDVLS